jgi:UDP-N-acetylglucosamine transferase subunit ALG13
MIFVIMGMEVHPFDRLAQAVDELARSGELGEEFFIQLGSCTYEPKHCQFQRYLSFGEVCEKVAASSCAITHAGVGSTLVCVQQGKHPIMVPRLSRYKEHVDEHQVPFAEKLRAANLATVVTDMSELGGAIRSVRGRTAPEDALGAARELVGWLEQFWQGLTARGGESRQP